VTWPILRDWRAHCALIAAAILVSYLIVGVQGAIGMACGIVGAGFNLGALRWIINLGSQAVGTSKGERLGAMAIVVAFFAKLPVFIVLGLVCRHIGPACLNCFLIAIGLVYSAIIGLALAPR
jgi:hypothetical protein